MNVFCFLCHRTCSNQEDLKSHLEDDHGAQQNVDLLIQLQKLTEAEKLDLKKKLKERSPKAIQNDSVKLVQNDVDRCSNVSTKIMFWSKVEKNPKQLVKECPTPGVHVLNKDEAVNNTTLDIFDDIVRENYEEGINDSIDEHFDILVNQDKPCKPVDDPRESRESAKVPRRRRKPSSKRIQWWRFFAFEYFY